MFFFLYLLLSHYLTHYTGIETKIEFKKVISLETKAMASLVHPSQIHIYLTRDQSLLLNELAKITQTPKYPINQTHNMI